MEERSASTMQSTSMREEVVARVQTLKVLPTLRTIINQLLDIITNKDASLRDVFNVVRYDQAITSKILSVANSVYYNRGSNIVDLERAMIAIGLDEIKKIIMCVVFLKEILGAWNLSPRDLALLWAHSLSVGCAARILNTHTTTENPETVFTASILHDIGKVIFYTFGEKYYKIEEGARKAGVDVCDLEKEEFGLDHQTVGFFMSKKWGFPEEISAVIQGHHGMAAAPGSLLHIVSAADTFINRPQADIGPDGSILLGERETIADETRRISEYLKIDLKALPIWLIMG
jgi:putative nucleotidyltransferase with HDIG domain